MNESRIRELFSKWLAGATLSREEEEEVLRALESSDPLALHLVRDAQLDGLLQNLLHAGRGSEALEKTVLERLEADRDATRFIKQIESKIESSPATRRHDPPEKPLQPEGSGGGPRRLGPERVGTTRRVVRKSQETRPQWAQVLLWAAAGLVFMVILFQVLSPGAPDPGTAPATPHARIQSPKREAPSGQFEPDPRAEEQAQAEAEQHRQETEARLKDIERRKAELARPPKDPGQDPVDLVRQRKALEEVERERERVERELREATALAQKPQPATPDATPKDTPSSRPPAPAEVPSTRAAEGVVATVEEVEGDTFRLTQQGKVPLAAGAKILSTEGVESGRGPSRIVLRFPDKTRVDLGALTLLENLSAAPGKRLTLTQGTLRAVVTKQPKGEPMIVSTPRGTAKVLGTTLRLVVDPDPKKETRLEVEEGKVEFKDLAGKVVLVESGHVAVSGTGTDLVSRVLPPRLRCVGFVFHFAQAPWTGFLQNVALVPGQTYRLSVLIQTSNPFPGGLVGVRESGVVIAQEPYRASDSFLRTSLTFKAGPTGQSTIFAGFANNTSIPKAWIHFVDWSLVEKGTDGPNLIRNPDYEGFAGFNGPWYVEGPREYGVANNVPFLIHRGSEGEPK